MTIIVVGAGPAGLATAASLKMSGLDPMVIERAPSAGDSWRHHYDRLHLHTPKSRSALPGLPMPRHYPRYPSRAQFVKYLEDYAQHFDLNITFGSEVSSVIPENGRWRVGSTGGGYWLADQVVMATGMTAAPKIPKWPGLRSFTGNRLHSSAYQNARPFKGQKVMVVGFGNSGAEIALDLAEADVDVSLVVRGPVNLLPKEIFGVPVPSFGALQRLLPYRVCDALFAPVLKWKMGDYARYGLQKSLKGPMAQVVEDGRVPMIDIGCLEAIQSGKIRVLPGIALFDNSHVVLADGRREDPDVVILATGYQVDLRAVLGPESPALDREGQPWTSGKESRAKGLWFCSYHARANGQLHQIGTEAKAIAREIAVASVKDSTSSSKGRSRQISAAKAGSSSAS